MTAHVFDIGKARAMRLDRDRVGIETEYAGVLFRSRLEARWASMFDALKWPWQYEPVDLSGYVPDFIVAFARAPLLIEVKPAMAFEELHDHGRRICMSGWRGDFLIVGARLLPAEGDRHRRSFGLLGLWDKETDDGWQPPDHGCAIHCRVCRSTSIRHASAEWFCIACGARGGRVNLDDAEVGPLERAWNEAGSKVRWRP